MTNIYKVVWKTFEKEKRYCYYESSSISTLIGYLSYNGFSICEIIEIKQISRLPKFAIALKGYETNK